MKNFNYLIILLFIGNSFMVSAQNAKQKKADRLFNDLAYIEAVEVFKELIEKDYNTTYNNQKLGDSYMKLRSPENAVFYYADALKFSLINILRCRRYALCRFGWLQYE